jgi:predicted transcriptional regulator
MKKNVLLSIKPEFAQKIITGEKTVELRRKFPIQQVIGQLGVIYASSPLKKIIGYAVITNVSFLPIDQIWSQHGEEAKVEKDFFDKYYSNLTHGFVIHLREPLLLERQICYQQLRDQYGIFPPQSFRYLSEEVLQTIIQ